MNGGRITSDEKSTVSAYIGLSILVILTAGALYLFFLAQKEKKETTGFDPNRPVPSDAVLKTRLKAEEYFVVREGGTQTPFQNEFWDNDRSGIYVDVITANHSSLRSTNSIAASACPLLANRSRRTCSSRTSILRTTCSAPRYAPNGAMPILAISFRTRSRPPANAIQSTPPPCISFPSSK